MRLTAGVSVLIILAGCNRSEVSRRTRIETEMDAPKAVAAPPVTSVTSLRTMLTDADGNETGNVRRLRNGFLTIVPTAGPRRHLRLRLLPTAPVLLGRLAKSHTVLAPGTPVRVYYKNAKGAEPPEAIGVEVLPPEKPAPP